MPGVGCEGGGVRGNDVTEKGIFVCDQRQRFCKINLRVGVVLEGFGAV